MRHGWRRLSEWVDLTAAEVAALVRPAVGDARVVSIRPVSGGLVNTNLEVTLSNPPVRVLLRIFRRDPPQARKEAELDRLLVGRVPTAPFLHFAEANPVTGGPYAVLQWIEGERLDHAINTAAPAMLATIGAAVGDALARVHAFRFDQAGFFTDDLRVPVALDFSRTGLLDFMRGCLRERRGGERLGTELTDQCFAFVEREGQRLDAWLGDPRLTHADFNPSNILMRRDGAGWRVAAILDWEFALSATPALDFANILRPPLGEPTIFADGLARGYCAAGGKLPADWHRIARIADLFAWSDLLDRRGEDAALVDDARRIVAATIRQYGDP